MKTWSITAMLLFVIGVCGLLYVHNHPDAQKALANPANNTALQDFWGYPLVKSLAGSLLYAALGILLGLPIGQSTGKYSAVFSAVLLSLAIVATQPGQYKVVLDVATAMYTYTGMSLTAALGVMCMWFVLSARSNAGS